MIVGALVPAGAGAANACDGGHHDRQPWLVELVDAHWPGEHKR